MSRFGMPLDAAALDFASVTQLRDDTQIAWGELTAAKSHMYSPSLGAAFPDYTVFPDPTRPDRLYVFRSVPRSLDTHKPIHVGTRTLGAALEWIDATEPVWRFEVGTDLDPLDPDGDRLSPSLAVWTGPIVDAAFVPAAGGHGNLRGRIVFRNQLSDRTNIGDEDPGLLPHPKIILEQHPSCREWTLRSGPQMPSELHESGADLRTLDDVLTWAVPWLAAAADLPYALEVQSFVVSTRGPGHPLTVRVW
ncbi:hypothetical protein EDF52_113134 [Curtobacterium sp. PhB42]|nr:MULTISPECIES: hypothetical protein [unclassified Curtobacterium]TCU82292.1 hypothetical protein EDF48_11244 [Curtobacterium sp. PhB191]TDW43180.1 hypothetical protein EDF52_113134 [Curtobacterium sp. PhB42]TDW53523.1 hypothetical protein EDF47_10935 [Curtobacterium sp. PhB190]